MSEVSRPSRSFEPDAARTAVGALGQLAHVAHLEQSERVARQLYEVRPGVWCLVGNGLSNQTFVEGPGGLIAIDTGESVEEMRSALRAVRAVTDRPVVAVLYTHFHYVNGTAAVDEEVGHHVPVFGHQRIALNRARVGAEVAPTYGRGVAHQFALLLPPDGPDAAVNVGLGSFYRNPDHAPFTNGHRPVDHPFAEACVLSIAGLDVHVTPAPSDADDSVTFWFPSLGVAVNNLVWPGLFNVFAIRTEEYRDPRILLAGLDHLISLGADHLVGTHGPPLSGDDVPERVLRYRDAIQLMWDQTVRLTNHGCSSTEIAQQIRLPDRADEDYLTSELYGVTEHHVRQIQTGLFGFFDGDEANLFPLARPERSARLIAGFGGRDAVRHAVGEAIATDDLRWALEMGSWLVHSADATASDRNLLAQAVRRVGQRSSAANIRNWCLTRARELSGETNNDRLYTHRFPRSAVLVDPAQSVHSLRVTFNPVGADHENIRLGWTFDDGPTVGLHIRNGVACPTDGAEADARIMCALTTWADILGGRTSLGAAVDGGMARIEGDAAGALRVLACFDPEGLHA